MHRSGLQVADARQFRNKWMTRLSKLERTDAVAIERAGFDQPQNSTFSQLRQETQWHWATCATT